MDATQKATTGTAYESAGIQPVYQTKACRLFVCTATGNFGAGFVAQLMGSLAWVPMEVVKEKVVCTQRAKFPTYL
jgi:hypothetical protein